MSKIKTFLRVLSLAFFVVPPATFVYVNGAEASIFAKINISGCLILIIGILLANRFLLSGIVERWRAMTTQWRADLKVEPDATKQQSLRHNIAKYDNILLAIKIPLPAATIAGLLAFLSAVKQTAASISAMLGLCSLFWIVGVALLFAANSVGARKP